MNPLLVKAAPYLAVTALLFLGKCGYDAKQREIGAMKERLRYTSDSLRVAKAEGRLRDSAFRVDTVRLTRRIVSTQTLLDTLRLSDTVVLTQRESVLVFVADSLVQQCRATVASCSALTANLQRRLTLTESQRDAYRKLVPNQLTANAKVGAAIVVGFALCKYVLCPKPK